MILKTTRQRIFSGLGGLALLATLGFSPTATAGPGGEAQSKNHGAKKIERMCERLECTDKQETELRSIFKELRTDLKSDREGVQQARQAVATEFAKDRPNEANMKRAYKTIDDLEDNIRDRTHDALMEAHGILNSAQRKEFAKFAARMGKRKGGKHHGKRGGGPGKNKGKSGKSGKSGKKR